MAEAAFHFARTDDAARMVEALTGAGLADHSAGLFLAAPRRTGKSTFLRRDLVPALEAAGVLTIYVDLWKDRARDPGDLIADALRGALAAEAPALERLVHKAGLTWIGLGPFASFDLERLGKAGGETFADALERLHLATERPIALIVDEAQHALSSAQGINAMFALKAARDHLNQRAGGPIRRLMLVFTGSHRDKLAHLVVKRDQPFFGASVTAFPLLGRDFADALTVWVNRRLAADNQLAADAVAAAFRMLGSRPEHLRQVIAEVALGEGGAARLGDVLAEKAGALRRQLLEVLERDLEGLTALQRAIVWRMAESATDFAPFRAESLAAYTARVGREVEASDVQAALDALRRKGVVWKSERGSYLLEDPAMAEAVRLLQP